MSDPKNQTPGPDFGEILAALAQEENVEARLKLCEEYLNAGTLGRRQMGVLYGAMGAAWFELAYERMRAACAVGKPSAADVAQAEQDFRRSVQQYTTAMGMNPGNYVDFWNRGFSYEFIGEFDRALSDYTETVKLKPDFAQGYLYRARIHQRRGETAKAIADVREAHRLDPSEPAVVDAMSRLGLTG
jgi:tetratricopeptide (TPR) repeat protein